MLCSDLTHTSTTVEVQALFSCASRYTEITIVWQQFRAIAFLQVRGSKGRALLISTTFLFTEDLTVKFERFFKRLTASALAATLVFGVPLLPETITGLSGLCIEAKATTETPEPPSKNYTGFITDNGNKYYFENGSMVISAVKDIDGKKYLFGKNGNLLINGFFTIKGNKYHTDKDGVVSCKEWFTLKDGSYYYAKSSGKLTKYSFAKEKDEYYLYINDVKATAKDLPAEKIKELDYKTWIYYKIANDYYLVYFNGNSISMDDFCSDKGYDTPICDIITGKYLGTLAGKLKIKSNGLIYSGKAITNDGYILTFRGRNKQPKKSVAAPLYITYKKVSLNSVGGVDLHLNFINGSKKEIKYVYLSVYGVNRVNDVVKDEITNDIYTALQYTGPLKSGDANYEDYWSAFMYNKSVKDVKIGAAIIEYMDGTKKELKGSQIKYLG